MSSDSPAPASAPRFPRERIAAARARLSRQGLSPSDWARREGYAPGLVRNILAGTKPCATGVCHDIAVMLGLKTGRLRSGQLPPRERPIPTEPRYHDADDRTPLEPAK